MQRWVQTYNVTLSQTVSCNKCCRQWSYEVQKTTALHLSITLCCSIIHACNYHMQPSCVTFIWCDGKIPTLAEMGWCYDVTTNVNTITVIVYPSTHVRDGVTLQCYITCLYPHLDSNVRIVGKFKEKFGNSMFLQNFEKWKKSLDKFWRIWRKILLDFDEILEENCKKFEIIFET